MTSEVGAHASKSREVIVEDALFFASFGLNLFSASADAYKQAQVREEV